MTRVNPHAPVHASARAAGEGRELLLAALDLVRNLVRTLCAIDKKKKMNKKLLGVKFVHALTGHQGF